MPFDVPSMDGLVPEPHLPQSGRGVSHGLSEVNVLFPIAPEADLDLVLMVCAVGVNFAVLTSTQNAS